MLMNPPTVPRDYVNAPSYEELVNALEQVRHATAPTPDDGGHHEAAHDLAQPNPWRAAVEEELNTCHMCTTDDPRESIKRLIDWHCAVQLDPAVSSAAQALIERGKMEERDRAVAEKIGNAGGAKDWDRW